MSTITDNDRRIQYTTAGGESSFSYDFQIDDADHVAVYRDGTLLTRGTDYSVTGVGDSSGGDIVPDGSLTIAADEVWTIEGDTPEDRSNDYSGFTTVKPATVDADLDRMIFMLQQLRRDSNRAIRIGIEDATDEEALRLPGSAKRRNRALVFDKSGNVTVGDQNSTSLDEANLPINIDSVADLRNAVFDDLTERVWLQGYYGVGTAGGGPLYRDADDTTTADNGGTVFVDADGVRWKRPSKGELNIEEWGAQVSATVDGTKDASSALSNALSYASSNLETVVVPGKKFYFGTQVTEFFSGCSVHFDGTKIITDLTDRLFLTQGESGAMISDVSYTGHINYERVSGTTSNNLFRFKWVSSFETPSIYAEGPGETEESGGIVSVQDCERGHIRPIVGINIGTNVGCVFAIAMIHTDIDYAFCENGAETIDLSLCHDVNIGTAIGKNIKDEVVDMGNTWRCRVDYAILIGGGPNVVNLKNEAFDLSGLVTTFDAVEGNTLGYVWGENFDRAITFGSGPPSGSEKPFNNNRIEFAILESSKAGSTGIRPLVPAGETGSGNSIGYVWVKTAGRAFDNDAGDTFSDFVIESGYFESTVSNISYISTTIERLFIGSDVTFKGSADTSSAGATFQAQNVLEARLNPTVLNGGREAFRLTAPSTGEIVWDLSPVIKESQRTGVQLEFDSGSSGTRTIQCRLHDAQIRDTNEDDGFNYAYVIENTNGGALQGVVVENNHIAKSDGGAQTLRVTNWNAGIGTIDYCAERYNDCFNAQDYPASGDVGTNGQFVAGIEN